MTTADPQTVTAPTRDRALLVEVLLLAGVVLATAAVFAVGQLLPWWINGFAGQPLDSWSLGQQDPKDVWPAGTPLGGWVALAGWLSVLAVPAVALGGGLTALVLAVDAARRGGAGTLAAAVVTLTVCVALAGMCVSPLGQALTSGRLD